jgi:OmpA-OmpF porin, OOP family
MRLLSITCIFLFACSPLLKAQPRQSYTVTLRHGDYKPVPFSNAFRAEEFYGNKKLRFKGKFLKCTSRNGVVDGYEQRKIGKWIYYHTNGMISRIEQYNNPKSCITKTVRNGTWQYFNPNGQLYHEEIYKNDTLVSSVVEVYLDSTLVQQITTHNTVIDTVQIAPELPTENLVINGDFEQYIHKPVFVLNDGHNTLNELIPGWTSATSADYYHKNRKVLNVPNHVADSIATTGYVGILAYNSRDETYREHIQTKLRQSLIKGQRYCLSFDMMLSINAGFYIEKIEAVLSPDAIKINTQTPFIADSLYHVTYASTFDNTNNWQQVCDCFIADGTERYLTLGLFSLNDAGITPTVERYFSALDINAGAYYLFDNVVVKAVSESVVCNTKPVRKIKRQEQQLKLKQNIFAALLTGKAKSITFKNVQFETNRSDLKQESFPELEQLLIFLENSNASIEIAGFTDNVGQAEHNQILSLARAESIKNWLVKRGIETERLLTVGFGASNFVADNTNEENRQRNRRVEIRLVAAE